MPLPRKELPPVRLSTVGDYVVEATPLNVVLGLVDSWWGVIFGWTLAMVLAVVLLNFFGVTR